MTRPGNSTVQIGGHFVHAGHHDHLTGAKAQGRHTVTGTVDIHQLAVLGNGVAAHQEGIAAQRLINLVTAWNHEIKEIMGGMGINSIEALRGNRLMLRGVGLNQKELDILGIMHAGE